jgi:hypothetical protein
MAATGCVKPMHSQSGRLGLVSHCRCGGGLAISRVDVSADEGATWERADITEQHTDPVTGRTWCWAKWQIPLAVSCLFAAPVTCTVTS